MVSKTVFLCLTVAFLLFTPCESAESSIWERILCSLSELLANIECCRSTRVDFRHEEFRDAIKERLFGQPMAADLLASAVSKHWNSSRRPRKALVLTLHGPTGTGKTYISKILANYTFSRGHKSQFYHFFSAVVHFPYKEQQIAYRNQLRSWIPGNVSYCEKSLFVFDEVEKMPVSLLDSLKPFLDYDSVIDGVDFSRTIFMFLSNIGSEVIAKSLANWKRQGRDRADFQTENLDRQLSEHAFASDESSLKGSALLRHHLISHFIPFLPLETEHVEMCISNYLKEINREAFAMDRDLIQDLLDKIPFVPEEEKFFSSYGCRRVPAKVDEALEALLWNRRTNQMKARGGGEL